MINQLLLGGTVAVIAVGSDRASHGFPRGPLTEDQPRQVESSASTTHGKPRAAPNRAGRRGWLSRCCCRAAGRSISPPGSMATLEATGCPGRRCTSKAGRRSLDWTIVRSHGISRWQRPRFGRPKPNTIGLVIEARGCLRASSPAASHPRAGGSGTDRGSRVAGKGGGGTPACLGRGTRREAGARPISCGRCGATPTSSRRLTGRLPRGMWIRVPTSSRSTPIVRADQPGESGDPVRRAGGTGGWKLPLAGR